MRCGGGEQPIFFFKREDVRAVLQDGDFGVGVFPEREKS